MVASTDTDVIGKRIGAALIDIAVLAVLFVGFGLVFGGADSTTTSTPDGEIHGTSASVSLSGVPAVLYFVVVFAYYFVLEWRYGQTLGKRAVSIRVVALDGDPLTARPIFLRTLGRIIDVLPVLYLLGLIVLVSSRPPQRIGDRFARTSVARA